jgi:L-alanine-DL-glutamate epimerase-like enolase superfamily enzyme
MALCDLVGKALDAPAYTLLGGAYRDEARVYLDRSAPEATDDLDAWRRMAEETVAGGFDFLKFDVDYAAPSHAGDPWNRSLSTAEINRIVERIDVVREAIGPDVELAVDCHWQYNATDAVRLAKALEPYDLRWFEDPCTETDLATLRTIRERTDVPLCVGEMLTIDQFKEVINGGACDVAHPDVLFAGGLHGTKRVADYAEANRVPVAFHGNGACLATVAAAHVGAASRNFLGLEYHHAETDWLGAFVSRDDGQPLFDDGHVPLTDAPGLGVELDAEVCGERYADGEQLF